MAGLLLFLTLLAEFATSQVSSATGVPGDALVASLEADAAPGGSTCLLQRGSGHLAISGRRLAKATAGDAPMASLSQAMAGVLPLGPAVFVKAKTGAPPRVGALPVSGAAVSKAPVQAAEVRGAAGNNAAIPTRAAVGETANLTKEASLAKGGLSEVISQANADKEVSKDTHEGNSWFPSTATKDVAARGGARSDGGEQTPQSSDLDYLARPLSQVMLDDSAGATIGGSHEKSKVALLVIDLIPLCWVLGFDRVYLGSVGPGISKGLLSCCFLGYLAFFFELITLKPALFLGLFGLTGLMWGIADFSVVLVNAFLKEETLDVLGMQATFKNSELQSSVALAAFDILMLPAFVYACWLIKKVRDAWRRSAEIAKWAKNTQQQQQEPQDAVQPNTTQDG